MKTGERKDANAEATAGRVTVTVAGSGAVADSYAGAFRALKNVTVHTIDTTSDDSLLAHFAETAPHAVVFVTPALDLQGAIKRALMAKRHVLVAGPVAMASKQITSADAAARSRNRVLMFDTGHLADERIDFVRRMSSGPQALWRPRYLRSLRTGDVTDATLDELAIADIASTLSLLGAVPSRVSAVTPRIDDESGAAEAAMVTMLFDGGPAARVDVSLMEPEPRHEIVIACDGRTVVLDAFDVRAPIKITASARHHGPQRHGGQWAETITEHPSAIQQDRLPRAAAAFCAAVRARDIVASNAAEIASAALVWEAARASIAANGDMTDVESPEDAATRPSLQIIHGGGHTTEALPPELTLISRKA